MRRFKKTRDLRAPISEELLGKICCALFEVCHSEYEILLFYFCFSLAFCGLFSVEELVYTSEHCAHMPLQIEDIDMQFSTSISAHRVSISVRFSKTDQKGHGTRIILPSLQQRSTCPVSRLQTFLEARRRVQGFLFVHDAKSLLNRFRFNAVLRKTLLKINHQIFRYKSHSFRIGGATCLASRGVSHDKIQLLGSWKSNAFLKYIRLDMI